jgi:hypothetical protein
VFNPKTKGKVSGADKLAQAREAGAAVASRARYMTSAATQTTAQRATRVAALNAQNAAQGAAQGAQMAVQVANAAAQTAAHMTGKSIRQGMDGACGWAAPRLENAADYCTATAAPRVSSALRSTARQISPGRRRKKGIRSSLQWSLLATAAFAAAGAAAMFVRQRYRAAMAADTEEDTTSAVGQEMASAPGMDMSGMDTSAPTGSVPPAGPVPADGSVADAGVNGRVSASG